MSTMRLHVQGRSARPIALWLALTALTCSVIGGDFAQATDRSMRCTCKSTHFEDPSFSITCQRSSKNTWNTQDKTQWNDNEVVLVEESSLVCKKERGPPPPSDYEAHFNSRYYKLHTELAPWEAALRACAREGANLAVVRSDAEAGVLAALFKRHPAIDERDWVNFQAWVGVNDLKTEGRFLTISGQPLESVWAKWSEDEPNDRGEDGEDCVAFLRDGTLNDLKCHYQLPFFCERPFGS